MHSWSSACFLCCLDIPKTALYSEQFDICGLRLLGIRLTDLGRSSMISMSCKEMSSSFILTSVFIGFCGVAWAGICARVIVVYCYYCGLVLIVFILSYIALEIGFHQLNRMLTIMMTIKHTIVIIMRCLSSVSIFYSFVIALSYSIFVSLIFFVKIYFSFLYIIK